MNDGRAVKMLEMFMSLGSVIIRSKMLNVMAREKAKIGEARIKRHTAY